MNKIFTEEELLKMRAIRALGFDITNKCYQLIDEVNRLQNLYAIDPEKVNKYSILINELMNYITETVIEKYMIENKQK